MVFSNRWPEEVKKIDPKELDKLLEEMGGEDAVMQGFNQYGKDRAFLDKNFPEWRKLYPDCWVVVFMEELIAVEKDIFKLSEIIKKKNIPHQYTAPVVFLDIKPLKKWILIFLKKLAKAA